MTQLEGELKVERIDDQLHIEVVSFSSSHIAAQLSGMNHLDWRISVEGIALDLNYDGKTFKPDIVDEPKTAIEYVKGSYTVPLNKTGACLAVKITDILGASIVLTKKT